MKNVQGIWLPDHEEHLIQFSRKLDEDGRWSYQFHKLKAGISLCRSFRTAVDVGGHVGQWSRHLAHKFIRVVAFEPVSDHRECFTRNVTEENVELLPFALGDAEKKVSIYTTPGSSGDSWVEGVGEIEMKTLDSMDIPDVDFIKLDCEGYEYYALKGGEKTIRKWMPAIVVEQKPRRAEKYGLPDTHAVTWLEKLGYRLYGEIAGDFFLAMPADWSSEKGQYPSELRQGKRR